MAMMGSMLNLLNIITWLWLGQFFKPHPFQDLVNVLVSYTKELSSGCKYSLGWGHGSVNKMLAVEAWAWNSFSTACIQVESCSVCL